MALIEIELSKNRRAKNRRMSLSRIPQDGILFLRLVKLPTSSLIFPRVPTTRHLSPPRDFWSTSFLRLTPSGAADRGCSWLCIPTTVNAHLSVMSIELGSTELQRPVTVALHRTVVSATRHTQPTTSEAGAPSSHTGADLLGPRRSQHSQLWTPAEASGISPTILRSLAAMQKLQL